MSFSFASQFNDEGKVAKVPYTKCQCCQLSSQHKDPTDTSGGKPLAFDQRDLVPRSILCRGFYFLLYGDTQWSEPSCQHSLGKLACLFA